MRGRKTACVITLDPQTQVTLNAWVTRRRMIPVALAKRAQMVLMRHAGKSIVEIGATVGMSRRHCYKWLTRFRQYGLAGLYDRREGQPTPLPPEEE